jgi:hypothetical protein
MLRRVMLLGGMLLVGVIVLGGVALADDIRGTFGNDNLTGTNQWTGSTGSAPQTSSRVWEATTTATAAVVSTR